MKTSILKDYQKFWHTSDNITKNSLTSFQLNLSEGSLS